jgi:FkbM family methyltransferase
MIALKQLARVVLEAQPQLAFTTLEIGALPLEGQGEPAHQLLDAFPGSRVIAFELDKQLCAELNRKAKPGMRFYPAALGRTEEERPLYETRHPMCTSLYKPNEALLERYFNLEFAMLKSVSSVRTVSLDRFAADNAVPDVDFIKIDVQGAELDVFAGATATLRGAVAIVSEVEFLPLYVDQPLFGDVCRFLAGEGLMFHKLLGMAGRALKPTLMNDDRNFAVQHLWSDAMFVRDILQLGELAPDKLLKLAVFANLYRSPDLMFHCLERYEQRRGKGVIQKVLSAGA